MRQRSSRFTVTSALFTLQLIPAAMTLCSMVLVTPLCGQLRKTPILFEQKCAQVRTIALLPVKFDWYHLTAGGIREYNEVMSSSARNQIERQVATLLQKKGYTIRRIPDEPLQHAQWSRLRHFYSVVNNQIQMNVFGSGAFPYAESHFAYSLSPIPDSLNQVAADAFLFIDGFDDRATRQREKRVAAAEVGAVIGAVLTGYYGGSGVPEDRTFASCALVNRWGEIIWYFLYTETGKIDMVQNGDCESFFYNLLNRFPTMKAQP
jgi:hypothetical protein